MNLKAKEDKRSPEELIQAALKAPTEDIYWNIVSILHHCGDFHIFSAATKLCASSIIAEKKLGIDILGQLGIPNRSFPEASFKLLTQILTTETNASIISTVGFALGHLQNSSRVEFLVKLKNHPSADVRLSVAFGLLNLEDELAINTLIELSNDVDANVRNWSIFGLGDMIEIDTEAVREALWQRLNNENDDSEIAREIRAEALLGLAKRRDCRIINLLIAELSSNEVSRLAVAAAQAMADVRLYPILLNLSDWWHLDVNLLTEAIQNCQPQD